MDFSIDIIKEYDTICNCSDDVTLTAAHDGLPPCTGAGGGQIHMRLSAKRIETIGFCLGSANPRRAVCNIIWTNTEYDKIL